MRPAPDQDGLSATGSGQVLVGGLGHQHCRFIDMFTDKGRIWSNVIILCKGKVSGIVSKKIVGQGPGESAAEDCKGAVMAAKKVNVHAEPRTVGYQFATAKVLWQACSDFLNISQRDGDTV